MVMAVVPRDEADRVLDALIDAGHAVTFMESRGGMLRQSQLTLFTAVKAEVLDDVLSIIRLNCSVEVAVCAEESEDVPVPGNHPVTARLGGAVLFVWDLERVETCRVLG